MSSLVAAAILLAAGVIAVALEHRGRPPRLRLIARRDVLRETAFVAQYGQLTCVAVAAVLVGLLDSWRHAVTVALAPAAATVAGWLLKRLAGRVRPPRAGRDDGDARPGAFLGPTLALRGPSWRESFPSSHAASAAAFSLALATLYPDAAAVFLALAVATAALRWATEAHWLGDVLVGLALGLAVGRAALAAM